MHASRCVETRRARRLLPLLTAPLLALAVLAPLAVGSHESNIQIVWKTNEINVIVPAIAWNVVQDAGRIGCAGTVRISGPVGGTQTVVGVGLGPTACNPTAPCLPYSQLSPTVTCTSSSLLNPVFLTVPASASGNITTTSLGCLKQFNVTIDFDGDHEIDSDTGPFFGFASCSHWGQ